MQLGDRTGEAVACRSLGRVAEHQGVELDICVQGSSLQNR
jgi:hypothetical protein